MPEKEKELCVVAINNAPRFGLLTGSGVVNFSSGSDFVASRS